MQKVVGSNPISRFPLQSQTRRRPASCRGPVVAQTASPVLHTRLVVALALGVVSVEPSRDH